MSDQLTIDGTPAPLPVRQRRNGHTTDDLGAQLDKALVVPEQGSGLTLPGTISETSLNLPAGLSFDAWQQVGHTLSRTIKAWKWWVGDWLNYGERTYGEMYSQAMDELGLSYGEVTKFSYVSRAVPPEIRKPLLSWSHHEAVAAVKDDAAKDALLTAAVSEGTSRAELREKAKQGAAALPPAVKAELACQCHCHHDVCQECNKPVGPL